MTASRPIGPVRTVRLIAGLAFRRQLNLWQSARLGRKKKDTLATGEPKRAGTPSKSKGRSIFSFFILLAMAFNGFNIGVRGLLSLSASTRDIAAAPSDRLPVSRYTEASLIESENALKRAQEISDPAERENYLGMWNRHVDELFLAEVRGEGLSEDDENSRVRQLRDTFDQRGAAGFTQRQPISFWISGDTWPREGKPSSVFFRSVCLIVLLWMPLIIFGSLGITNKNLGEVDGNLEWLYTFPASARALFSSKIFVYSFLNPLVWLFFFPFLILIYVAAGFGFAAIFVALAALLYLLVLAGSLSAFLEVALRKVLPPNQLKNVQALFTVVGSVAMLLAYAVCFSAPLEEFVIARATALPDAFAWNPFSIPLFLGLPSAPVSQVQIAIVLMIVLAIASCSLSLLGSEWFTRDGLIRAGGPYQGVRVGKTPPARSRNPWLRGIAAYELLHLGRDRNLLVQVFVVPLLLPGFYLLINPKMVSAVSGNFRHAAVLAFGIGAYSFISSAIPILNRENKTLWQLLTFPQSLTSILVKKAMVWVVIGLIYGGATLLAITHFSRHLSAGSWGELFLAFYGIGLYGFIASGIGILGANVLETEPRLRFRSDMIYLYMILAAMYANTIYSTSVWVKLAQLVLSTLLAFALWQKVSDAAPYLLDPIAQPSRNLSLADGLIAALAFFVLQGLIFLLIQSVSDDSLPAQITVAYVLAGLIVAGATLIIFWRKEVPDLWRKIGFVRSREEASSQPLGSSIARAVALGALAGAGAILYTHALNFFPQGQIWKQDAELSSFLSRADRPIWLCVLAIVAAPLFEEFLFRGLIFRGLRRTTGAALAILGSAAVFALVHPPISVIPVFGLGIAAAISFQKSGFLLAPIFTHAVYNTVVIFLNKL
jgi:ABC-2 type transport system permease protein